jgi:GNAT superfamily N-acetyltransferase
MEYEVRRIRTGDWQRYRELRLEALKDSPLAFVEQYDDLLTQPDQFWQDRVERSATEEAVTTFVAAHAGKLVGKASCFVEAEVTEYVSAHIVGVYVTPRFRGREVADEMEYRGHSAT